MTDWKIGHYEVGLRDGGSSWHTGTKIHRECTHPECIALFLEEAEIIRLRDALEGMVRQFGYWSNSAGGYHTGGLSALEDAFDVLGWDDPRPAPEARCDEPGCMQQISCGWPTRPGGTGLNGAYRRTCGDHYRAALKGE